MGTDCGHWYDDYGDEPDYRDDDDDELDIDDLDEWVFDCGDPKCCMNFAPHFRHECYTPEMYEAYVAEVSGEEPSGRATGSQS